jgi:transposase
VSKVELFEFIRKEHFNQEKSIHQIAREQKIHRRTVRQAIQSGIPPKRKVSKRSCLVLTEAVKIIVDNWLQEDLKAPKKQRHTGNRIYIRLVTEHQYQGSASSVRNHFYEQRKLLGWNNKAFIPQVHDAGEEAEVDWYEVYVDFPLGRQKIYIFQMRACYSGNEFHMAFERQNQPSFIEAHVAAFNYFGGVFKKIRYDNLTSAVKKVLRGRKRIETEKFILLRSHYLFEAVFCLPGIQGAHEKGGVEGGVGRFRRAHLVPVPKVKDILELNKLLQEACEQDKKRMISGQTESVEKRFETERNHLSLLPNFPFESFEICSPTVSNKSLATIKGNHYSVPVMFVGQTVEAQVHAQEIKIYKQGDCIAKHRRCYEQGKTITILDHYLPLLRYKPGALNGSLALAQSRAQGTWPALYDQYWQLLSSHLPAQEANKLLVDFLWWARDFSWEEIEIVLEEAIACGSYRVEVLQLFMRRLQSDISIARLEAKDLGKLIHYERPTKGIAHYDTLLTGGSL